MIKIKICGITDLKEINYVNILQPDYIGFVFTNSKRKVSLNHAIDLSKHLSNKIKTVGVFRNNSIKDILEIYNNLHLDAIQLHGKENETFIRCLHEYVSSNTEIWKAFSYDEIQDNNSDYKTIINSCVENIVIDGNVPGSGSTYELETIKGKLNCKFFLAGGITPENVKSRIEEIQPYGIDVSSGVEVIDEYGKRLKSFRKMRELITNIKNTNY